MAQMTFQDYKRRISIIEVALSLGYKLDKSAGVKYPQLVLTDDFGHKRDSIFIVNADRRDIQGYKRHNGAKGGDLIDFIKENINAFNRTGRNELDKINNILAGFIGEERTWSLKDYLAKNNIRKAKAFDLNRYELTPAKNRELYVKYMFDRRNLDMNTIRKFSSNIYQIRDKEAKYKNLNIGFPYRVPGNDNIVGFEIRGSSSSFKSKAEGTNSRNAVWSVDFTNGHPEKVKFVLFTESSFDAMAIYQANRERARDGFQYTAFVSTGGSYSEQQILETMQHYKNAIAYDCFDNDLAGRIAGCRMMLLLEGKRAEIEQKDGSVTFSVDGKDVTLKDDEVTVQRLKDEYGISSDMRQWKAPAGYKDWNDVTMGKKVEGPSMQQHLNELKTHRMKI